MSEPEETDPIAIVHSTQESLMLQIERYSSNVRALALGTAGVCFLLAVSYGYQILLGLTGPKTVTVDLNDPVLLAFEGGLTLLALAWLGLALKNYSFVTGVSRRVREVRAEEEELAKKYGLD